VLFVFQARKGKSYTEKLQVTIDPPHVQLTSKGGHQRKKNQKDSTAYSGARSGRGLTGWRGGKWTLRTGPYAKRSRKLRYLQFMRGKVLTILGAKTLDKKKKKNKWSNSRGAASRTTMSETARKHSRGRNRCNQDAGGFLQVLLGFATLRSRCGKGEIKSTLVNNENGTANILGFTWGKGGFKEERKIVPHPLCFGKQ